MKKYPIYIAILGLVGIAVAVYMYNKPHKNIQNSKTDFKIEAEQLIAEFEENETETNAKYLDKVIEVSGVVGKVNADEKDNISVTLEGENPLSGVVCQLDNLSTHARTNFSEGENVTFKGICTGLLMDVIMVRCVEVDPD